VLHLVILAAATAVGVPGPGLASLALALLVPVPLGAVLVVGSAAVAIRQRPGSGPTDAESIFLREVAAELRAGATLRTATVAAAERAHELDLVGWARHARAGLPMAQLAGPLGRRLPISGRAATAAVEFLTVSGAAAAEVFTRLAAQTDEAIELHRERAVASAQARLSAIVVAAAPLVVLLWLAARGALSQLLATGAGRFVLGAGMGLELAGIAVSMLMLRRSAR